MTGDDRDRAAPAVLSCQGLRKSYGDRVAVAGVGFDIARGETYGLLGPNGAGKTTTISMVCGLLARDAGEVVVAGQPLDERATAAKAAIGLVPQEVALYDDMSAEENLRFFGRLQGLAGRELATRVAEVLELVGLTDRGRERLGAYSGGMKRRANIAAGLLHRPQLLVLDEPTVGVDPQSRNAILGSVEALGDEGLSVLYTTHYMEEAERLCDRIGILDEGRLVAEGTRRELVARQGEGDRVVVTATGDLDAFAAACADIPGTLGVETLTPTPTADRGDLGNPDPDPDPDVRTARTGQVVVRVPDGSAALAGIVAAGERTGIVFTGVELVAPDLEDVFLALTGKALRD